MRDVVALPVGGALVLRDAKEVVAGFEVVCVVSPFYVGAHVDILGVLHEIRNFLPIPLEALDVKNEYFGQVAYRLVEFGAGFGLALLALVFVLRIELVYFEVGL